MRSAKFLPVLLMGAAGSALLAAAPATAQSNNTSGMEEVVVTGSLSGVAHGLAQQRQATTVQDVISSDDFSKLPDFNAAEALQRLPGVSLVEQAGEGRFVSIRGAKPNYNGTMLDGFTIPSADRAERRVDLQTIPNALIERIEVNKTATPDIPTEGIGGSVNIVPRNPATINGFMAGASAYLGGQQYDGPEGRAEAYLADTFGPSHQFGFSLDASFRQESRLSYQTKVKNWGQVTASDGSKVWSPTEFSEIPGTITRRNIGGDAALGAVFDHMRLEVRAFYSQFYSPSTVDSTIIDPVPAAAGGKALDFGASGGLVNATVNREFQPQTWIVSLGGAMIKGDIDLTDTINADFGYAHQNAAERYTTKFDAESKGVNTTTPLPLMIQQDRLALGPFNGAIPSILTAGAIPIAYAQNAPRDDEEAADTPYVNITEHFDFGDSGNLVLKGGSYLTFLNKYADLIQTRQNVVSGAGLTFANLLVGNPQAHVKNDIYFGTISNAALGESLTSTMPSAFGPVVVNNPRGLDPKDYNAQIDIQAYYGMATYTYGPLSMVAGGRYEEAHTTFVRTSTTSTNGLQYFDGTTAHFLPSVHLRYEVMPELVARASWSNTTARPDPQQIYANQIIDTQARTITAANPDLKPLKSENLDASLDWYFGPVDYLTVGLFSKDITDYPLTTQQTITFMGQLYNQTSIQSNARGSIRGVEAAYRQQFDQLPGLLSGLGVELNYAYIHSKLIYAARPDMPALEQQPSNVINASLVYAYGPAFLRLALAHTGKQIDDEGTAVNGPAFDIIVAPRTTLDMTVSYDLTEQTQAFAEWRNITNAPAVSYMGSRDRLSNWESFGMAAGLGIRMRF